MENYQIFVTFNPLVFSLYRQGLHSRAADNLPNLSWFNRTLYRMLKTQPKQALRVLLKTVEMVNTSTFWTGIYQHDFSHTFSCFSLPFSKCGHTQVTERSGRPVTWMKCWHFMLIQTNSNVLFIIPAFIQCVPNHVHTTCLWDDFHDGRWTGRSLASTASWDGGQAGDQCSLTYVGVQELDF